MTNVQIDKLIDATLAELHHQGEEAPVNLRNEISQIINTMSKSEILRFRLVKLIDRILPIETLKLLEAKIEANSVNPDDFEKLADHHEALDEIQLLMGEYLKAELKRRAE